MNNENFAARTAPTLLTPTLVAVACALFATSAATHAAQPERGAGEFVPGRIIVEARAGLSNADLDKLIKPHGGKARKLGQSNLHVIELPGNASEVAVLKQLEHRPEFKFAELDRIVESTLAVNDPYIGSQWHTSKIGATAAWDAARGAGVTIAIIDSGTESAHTDLRLNMVAGYNFYSGNTDTSDVCGHGTSVAGSAAATTNNGVGVAGVAGEAKIMPLRVGYFNATYNNCYASLSNIASAITYAADHGAQIANASYASLSSSSAVISAARYMKSKGGLVFTGAGNSNINETAVGDPALIVVSATDSSDYKTSWSSYGTAVALAAPGLGIWTTGTGGTYKAVAGTSFSSPVAAGVAALMMSARPDLSADRIQALLFSSAVDLGAAGRDIYFGYGRVNAQAAVAAAKAYATVADTTAPSAAISAPLGSSTVSGSVAVNVTAADNVGVARVELKVNGTVIGVDSAAPYGFSWNSTGVVNGMANLVAVAYDAAGNAGTSTTVAVNVANSTAPVLVGDTTAPVVTINNPVAGTVSGTVAVSTAASDNGGAAGITQSVFIDGVLKASGTGGSLAYNWNTRSSGKGVRTVTVTARDAAGNTTSRSVQVTVMK